MAVQRAHNSFTVFISCTPRLGRSTTTLLNSTAETPCYLRFLQAMWFCSIFCLLFLHLPLSRILSSLPLSPSLSSKTSSHVFCLSLFLKGIFLTDSLGCSGLSEPLQDESGKETRSLLKLSLPAHRWGTILLVFSSWSFLCPCLQSHK